MTQMELPLTQPKEFNELAIQLAYHDGNVQGFKQAHEFIMRVLNENRRLMVKHMQEICIHPSYTDDMFHDCHKNEEEWTRTCDHCGKILKSW